MNDDDPLASQTFICSDQHLSGEEDGEHYEYENDDGLWSSLLLSSSSSLSFPARSSVDSSSNNNNGIDCKRELRRKKKVQRQRLRRLLRNRNKGGPKVITLRSTLLALYLFITLCVFWLLDSIKDPILTILVDGELHKHQPYAKMVSVIGTLLCTIAIEIISTHIRKQRQQQQQQQQQMDQNANTSDESILSGGGTWTRMNIDTSTNHIQHNDGNFDTDENEEDEDSISVHFFKWLGIAFIVVLSVFAYLISCYNDTNNSENIGVSTKSRPWMGYALYFTIECYGSLCVASFWSFANTTLTLQAAEHYYGYIIALGQLGAIVGSTIATEFSKITPASVITSSFHPLSSTSGDNTSAMMPMLLLVACIGIFLSIVEINIYSRFFPNHMTDTDFIHHNQQKYNDDLSSSSLYIDQMKVQGSSRRNAGHMNPSKDRVVVVEEDLQLFNLFMGNENQLKGIQFILKHSYMLLVLGASCLYEISLTCLDYEMKLIGLERYGNTNNNNNSFNNYNTMQQKMTNPNEGSNDWSFAQFMGRYGQWTNITSLFLSYFIFPRLMQRYGLKYTIRLFPTLLLTITLVVFLALPLNLPVLVFSMCLLKAMTYSIHDPAKEILYIPTCSEIKFRSKFWIDVVGARIAKAIGSSINVRAGSAENIIHIGVIPSVVTAVALLLVSYKVGIVFERLISNHQIIGSNNNQIITSDIDHYHSCYDNEEEEYHFPAETEDERYQNHNDNDKFSSFTPTSSPSKDSPSKNIDDGPKYYGDSNMQDNESRNKSIEMTMLTTNNIQK